MEPMDDSAKSATDDEQSTTTRRTFLSATAGAATLPLLSSTASASTTRDVTHHTDYLEEWYEFDEREAARGNAVLKHRTPTVDAVAEYLNVDSSELTTICMASRFTGDDPDSDVDMALGVAEELHTLAETVAENAVEAERENRQ